jgi:L-fuculose-phosphate aldolase
MEVPDSIREYIKNSEAILLENHGALTLGSDLINAYHKMETLEHTASIVWKAIQLGNVNVLPEYERDRLMALRDNYGLTGRLTTCDATPMPSNDHPIIETKETKSYSPEDDSERTIKEITAKVLARLKQS